MKIELRLDCDGNPYLELYAARLSNDVENQALRLFIRRALDEGIKIVNEAGENGCDNYASIRLREVPKE